MQLNELESYIGQLLEISSFRDYCPNGVQVEGRAEVKTLVTGVSASMALLEAAVDVGADAILVHHGWFWKNEDACVTGIKRARLAHLLRRDISLLAYHLPLDAHPELGNNAQLAGLLGFAAEGRFGEQDIAAYGAVAQPMPLAALADHVNQRLARPPLVVGDESKVIRRIAWCSGAAQDYLEEAARLGVDAFLSGEISERTVHLARESGVAYIAAGHHATERGGIKALGEHLAARFDLAHRYIEIDNPV